MMTGFGNSLEEISKELEECEDVINALTVDVNKARNVLRGGKELMLEHPFTKESLGTCHFTTRHYCCYESLISCGRGRALCVRFHDNGHLAHSHCLPLSK